MAMQRLVIAQMKHETNTFSPVRATIDRFSRGAGRPREGEAAIAAARGTGSALGAFIELAENAGWPYVLPIAASAFPSGRVDDEAFEYIAGCIVDAVAAGCDGILLDLHGAMVTDSYDDAEGELLRRIRAVAPDVPIGVALDMHCNLSAATCALSTCVAGYQTYPHVDMRETGLRAGRPIMAVLQGKARPAMACGFQPMLPHVMRQSSLDSPNREIQARAREMEAQGVLSASLFVGFPHADVPCAGLSAVVVTDGDAALAQACCDELLDMAWNTRADWVYEVEPLAQSMDRAGELARTSKGPVVLLDHYDNCSSGGTMDTMAVLGAILDAGLDDVVAFAIYDPQAVDAMRAAGVGAKLTLPLGGKLDMPGLRLQGKPREVTGVVEKLVEGRFRNTGAMARGETIDMGPTVVFRVGGVQIVVISRQVEPSDPACFAALGIDPSQRRYLMLKSRVHWRAGLGDIAGAVVECAGEGVCTSDYSQLDFKRLGREVYPLSPLAKAPLRATSTAGLIRANASN